MTKLDFQPMPKRFMVWDGERFLKLQCAYPEIAFRTEKMKKALVYELNDLISLSRIADMDSFDIIQSTNLFDEDGKEIFEGSVLQKAGRNYLVVIEDGKAMCAGVPQSSLKAMAKHGRVVGHVLSNPELLEEK